MSDSLYPPGTLAILTLRNGNEHRAVLRGGMWHYIDTVGARRDGDSNIKSVQPLLVIDPGDRDKARRLANAFYSARSAVHTERIDGWTSEMFMREEAMTRALNDWVPQPREEVFRHVVVSDHPAGLSTSLCGKVWTPGKENIKVVGNCPECMTVVANWQA